MRRSYAAGGVLQRQLCDEFGMSLGAVRKILYRHTWRHVGGGAQ